MLFQVGSLVLDTFGLEVSDVSEEVSADFAEHELIGMRKDLEFAGPGEEKLDLSGKILPFSVGGLTELSLAKQLCRSGNPQFVVRGDGEVYGWFQIMRVKGRHTMIMPTGVGFVVEHGLECKRIDDPGQEAGSALIGTILSLFG